MSEPSAGQFKVECSCGKKLKLPVSAAGRRAKCPNCKSVFTVPSPPAGPAASRPDDGVSLLDDLAAHARAADAPPNLPAENASSKCTKCGADMPASMVLCVTCGHNVQTGRTLKQASARRSDIGAAARWTAARAGTFAFGCLLSSVGALIGAVIWSVVSITTNYEIVWIAWGLGGLAGYGMAVGYPTENLRAGVTAACIAMIGIVGAKLTHFVYVDYSELSAVMGFVVAVRDGDLDKRFRLAWHRSELEARNQGLSFDAIRQERLLDHEYEKIKALTSEELDEAVAELEAWEAGAKWDDEQYMRNSLIYAHAEEATEKLYPAQEYENPDERPTLTPNEWKNLYEAATAAVEAMTPEQRLARVNEISDEEERSAQANRLAYHRQRLRILRMGISYVNPRAQSLFDEELKRVQAFSDEKRTSATAELDAWEGGGKWQDQEYMRNHLIELRVDDVMGEFESEFDVYSDTYGTQLETEWQRQHKLAVVAVDALPVEQHAQHVRELEARAHDEVGAGFAKEFAGSALSVFFANYFGVFDILFSVLAVASAFKIATGGSDD